MPPTVVLVRHGQSRWNAQGRLQGQGGTDLSDVGRAQAAATADYLCAKYPDVIAAVGSDQQRAVETAAPWQAASGVKVRTDPRWREIDVGTWSGLTWAEVEQSDPITLAAWRAGNDVRRGGGETFAELRTRAWAALQDLRSWPGTVLVFTHGGTIRLGVAAALGLPVMGEHTLGQVANCGVTELSFDADRCRLLSYNSRVHLAGVAPPATS